MFAFPKVNFRKSNPNAIENPLKSQTVITFLAMQKSEKQNRAMQPKRIRQSPLGNANEKQWQIGSLKVQKCNFRVPPKLMSQTEKEEINFFSICICFFHKYEYILYIKSDDASVAQW